MKSLRRALIYLRPYWLTAVGALLSLILVSAANLFSPQILRVVIDQGISAGNTQALIWATAALLGVAVVRGLFSFTQGYLSERMSQSAAYEVRNKLFAKNEDLSFPVHDQAQAGQLLARLTSDGQQVRPFLGSGLL